jgi:membrane associated rhomboid family serine protease
MRLWDKLKYEFHRGNSAVKQIIIICVSVFVATTIVRIFDRLTGISFADTLEFLFLPAYLPSLAFKPWALLTYGFMHAGLWHIIGNMLMLYYIGNIFQDFLGKKEVWSYFLIGVITGGVFFVVSLNLFPALNYILPKSYLVGASAGVSAIVVGAGMFFPHYSIRPFGLFNLELRWLALILVFINLVNIPDSSNMGGIFAHLGGCVSAFFMVLYHKDGFNPFSGIVSFFKRKTPDEKEIYRNKKPVVRKNSYNEKPNQEEIDSILDKISQSGYNSLTQEEKEKLFKASE